MSIRLLGRAYELDLPPSEMFVLTVLCDHAHDDATEARPGLGLIEWKTGFSKRQVQRILGSLRDAGIIVPTGYANGGKGKATVYSINLDAGLKKAPLKDDVGVTLSQAKDDVGVTLSQAKDDAGVTLSQAKDDAGVTLSQAKDDAGVTLSQAKDDVGVTLSQAKDDAGVTLSQAKDDVGVTLSPTQRVTSEHQRVTSAPQTVTSATPKGDTGVTPTVLEPSRTVREPSGGGGNGLAPATPPVSKTGQLPAYWAAMTQLAGYGRTEPGKTIRLLEDKAAARGVDPAMVVSAFVEFYPDNYQRLRWRDPVLALRNTVDIQIDKLRGPPTRATAHQRRLDAEKSIPLRRVEVI